VRELPEPVPPVGGSYLFLLRLETPAWLAVGRLGVFDFPAGYYAYMGSAFGPGGLAARLSHHWFGPSRPRWHIDMLRLAAHPVGYLVAPGERGLECRWAQALMVLGGQVVAPGFGASDCRSGCAAHLVYFEGGIEIEELRELLKQ
jgi:Uri superfamily endonuclease